MSRSESVGLLMVRRDGTLSDSVGTVIDSIVKLSDPMPMDRCPNNMNTETQAIQR